MISFEDVPAARQHTHMRGQYNVHSLANLAKHAVEHGREPRWPHTREIMTPEELAHISMRAAATGWSPGRHAAATAPVPAALAGHAREAAAVRRELEARQARGALIHAPASTYFQGQAYNSLTRLQEANRRNDETMRARMERHDRYLEARRVRILARLAAQRAQHGA